MDFELNEQQEMLRDGLRELLDGVCPAPHVRAVSYEGDGDDQELWSHVVQAGWTALTIPEADGGAGLGFEELTLIAMEAGRAALPVPLTTTLLAARALARGDTGAARSATLGQVADGSASITLGLRGEAGEYNGERSGVSADRLGAEWSLSGELEYVPFGPLASFVLVEAHTSSGTSLITVPTDAGGVRWEEHGTMDRSVRRYRCILDGATVPAAASIHGERDAAAELATLVRETRASLAAESQGACERMLELTVEYAKDREQFGRPIGSNQAVKVRIAQMGAAVERMRAAVYYAALQLEQDADDRDTAVAMAKAATATPGAFVASQAIHVHGAIGFTWEHDVHFYVKRAKTNELLMGDEQRNLARIADQVFGAVSVA